MKKTMRSEQHEPWWKHSWVLCVILSGVGILLYAQTISYTYVGLDDGIFIRELESFNKSDTAFRHAFKRGVFGETTDTYYRPLLLASFAVDRYREGKRNVLLHSADQVSDSIAIYHWTNVLLHVAAVVLFFMFLQHLGVSRVLAFVGALLIAVHPVLVQAIAWIPGRNDTLLAVFTLAFFLAALRYVDSVKPVWLLAQAALYLAAAFTKETGLIASVVLLVVVVRVRDVHWRDKRLVFLGGSWLASGAFWFLARSNATVQNQDLGATSLIVNMVDRLPVVVQYLGKVILPANLNVVPYQEQTSTVFGIVSIAIIIALVAMTRERAWRMLSVAVLWFFVFLLPVLIVPRSLNQETYEHRLYIPIMGCIILLIHTDLFRRWAERTQLIIGVTAAMVLFVMSYTRMDVFRNREVFWTAAVAGSPQSAFCLMNLGSTYMSDLTSPRQAEGEELIRRAYSLDSTKPFVNYYMAQLLWRQGKLLEAEPFLRAEYRRKPNWAELNIKLAQCAIERRDLNEGQRLLERYRQLNPLDQMAATNLVLVCLDAGRPRDAQRHVSLIEADGLVIPSLLRKRMLDALAKDSLLSGQRPIFEPSVTRRKP